MEGFFTKKEVQSVSRPDGKTLSCSSCGLFRLCTSPMMKPYGNFKKGILNIGEVPGGTEDKTGKPFQGRTGKLLQETYKKLGIDFDEDCLTINAVRCFVDRTPANYEIDCCRRLVLKTIQEYRPKVIILLGNAAVYSLIGYRWKKDLGGITKWRGWTIPDQDFQAWVCPTFHPSYVERALGNDNRCVEKVIWENDLKQVFELLTEKEYQGTKYLEHSFPVYKEPQIEVINDLYMLVNIRSGQEIVFDFETNCLKPHEAGRRIICCSVALGEDHAYVFMMPKTPKERKPLVDLLVNEKIKKIAQNCKFEHEWAQVRLGVEVQRWEWDTMIMAHILDNREGITNLAFQTYVNFGIVDFKEDTQKYLEADKKNGNAMNKIFELIDSEKGKELLLQRCAMDSIFEYRLYKKQQLQLLPF